MNSISDRELLENRLDLIEKYFVRPSFEHKDYLAMQHELDTTEVGSTTISEAPHIKPLTCWRSSYLLL